MLLGEVNRLAESEYPGVDTCVAEVVLDSHPQQGKRSASAALLRVLDAQARRQHLCLRAPDFDYSHPDITHGERPGRSRLLLCSRTTFDSVSRERMTEIIDFVASCIYGNMYPEPAAASVFHASLNTWRAAMLARIPAVVSCDRLKDISPP